MAGSHIGFAGLVSLAQYGINAVQMADVIFLLRNRARLKLHLRALRQFDRFQWSEYAAFINRMDRFHALLLPYRWLRCQFLPCAR